MLLKVQVDDGPELAQLTLASLLSSCLLGVKAKKSNFPRARAFWKHFKRFTADNSQLPRCLPSAWDILGL